MSQGQTLLMNQRDRVGTWDRISRLSDDLLVHILSFLSTKESVRTSLLSTNWKLLWASVPVLRLSSQDFDFGPASDETARNANFSTPVDRFLLQKCSAHIEKICLRDGVGPFPIEMWVKSVKDHVQEMELDLYLRNEEVLCRFFEAPPSLFMCRMLVVLKLKVNITLDIPIGAICYPLLKVLKLVWVKYKEDTTVQNLISSCPVLEDLTIVTREFADRLIMPKFIVASQTLKRLTLHFRGSGCEYKPYGGNDRIMTVIDTPSLRFLDILDEYASEFVVGEMASVSEAKLDLRARGNNRLMVDSLFGKCLFNFLRAIYNTKYLLLSDVTMVSLMQAKSYEFPTFTNLTHLEVKRFDQKEPISLELLTEFINSSPKMERLVYESYEIHAKEADWIYQIRMCPNFFPCIYDD